MKRSSLIHPDSVMVTNEQFGKPSENSDPYLFPWKIPIGGVKQPTSRPGWWQV